MRRRPGAEIMTDHRAVRGTSGSVRVPPARSLARPSPVSERDLRALRVAEAGHRILLRTDDEKRLLTDICRAIVSVGGHVLACVGFAEHDRERSVRPVAVAGRPREYVTDARISWADVPRGRGPTGRAIRERRTQVNRNFQTDPIARPWRKAALQAGFHSSISIPLVIDGEAIGALTIYSTAPDAFDQDEARLLESFAEDLAFGIAALRARTEREAAQAEARRTHELYRTMVEALNDGVFLTDARMTLLLVNPRAAEMVQEPIDKLVGRSAFEFLLPGDAAMIRRRIQRRRAGLADRYELTIRRRDGSTMPVSMSASPHFDAQGRFAGSIAVFTDLTEAKAAEDERRRHEALIRSIIEASPDGIVAFDPDQRALFHNRRYGEMWRLDARVLAEGSGDAILQALAASLAEPAAFLARGRQILRSEIGGGYDELALADGRTFERYTAPIRNGGDAYLGVVAFLRDVTDKRRAKEERERAVRRWQESLEATIAAIAGIVEMRDPYTSGHQKRVADFAAAIARQLKLPGEQVQGIRLAGTIHDIGKITVPTELLTRPGKLSPLELQLIQGHAQAGYEVVKGIEFPWPIADAVRQHHERLDGSGYPQGLKGGQIILEARILTVADVVEAMASHRPYRPALGLDEACAEIENGRGRLYDPAVVDAALRLLRQGAFVLNAG